MFVCCTKKLFWTDADIPILFGGTVRMVAKVERCVRDSYTTTDTEHIQTQHTGKLFCLNSVVI